MYRCKKGTMHASNPAQLRKKYNKMSKTTSKKVAESKSNITYNIDNQYR